LLRRVGRSPAIPSALQAPRRLSPSARGFIPPENPQRRLDSHSSQFTDFLVVLLPSPRDVVTYFVEHDPTPTGAGLSNCAARCSARGFDS
jgi:hypothetical protein